MGTQISALIPDGDIRDSHTQEEFLYSMSSQNPKNAKPISKSINDVPKSYKNFVIITSGVPDHVKYWQEHQIFVCAFTISDPPIQLNYYHTHLYKKFSLVTIHLGKVSYQNMIFFMNAAGYDLSRSDFLNQIIYVSSFYENNSDYNDKISKCVEPKLTIASPKIAKLSFVTNNDNDENQDDNDENQYSKSVQKTSQQNPNEYSIIKRKGVVELSDNLDRLSESYTPTESNDVDEHQLIINLANSSSITISTFNSEGDSPHQKTGKKQKLKNSPLKKRKEQEGSFVFSEGYNDGYNDNETDEIDIQPISKKKPKNNKNSKKGSKNGNSNKSSRRIKRKNPKITIIEDRKKNDSNSGSLSEDDNNKPNKRNLEFNIIEDRKNNQPNQSNEDSNSKDKPNKRNLEFNIIEDRKNNQPNQSNDDSNSKDKPNKRNLEFNIIEDRKNNQPNQSNEDSNSKDKPNKRNLELNIIEDRNNNNDSNKNISANDDSGDDKTNKNKSKPKNLEFNIIDDRNNNNLQPNSNSDTKNRNAKKPTRKPRRKNKNNDNSPNNTDNSSVKKDLAHSEDENPDDANDSQFRNADPSKTRKEQPPKDKHDQDSDPNNNDGYDQDHYPYQGNRYPYQQDQEPNQLRNRDIQNQYPNNYYDDPKHQAQYPYQGSNNMTNRYPNDPNNEPYKQNQTSNQRNGDPNHQNNNPYQYDNDSYQPKNRGINNHPYQSSNRDHPINDGQDDYKKGKGDFGNGNGQGNYGDGQGNYGNGNGQGNYGNGNGQGNYGNGNDQGNYGNGNGQGNYGNGNGQGNYGNGNGQGNYGNGQGNYGSGNGQGNYGNGNGQGNYGNGNGQGNYGNGNGQGNYGNGNGQGNYGNGNGQGNYGNGNGQGNYGNGNGQGNYGNSQRNNDRNPKNFNRVRSDSPLDNGTGFRHIPDDNNHNLGRDDYEFDGYPHSSQRGANLNDPNEYIEVNPSNNKKIRKLRSVSPSYLPNSKQKPSARSPRNSVTVNFSISGKRNDLDSLFEEEEEEASDIDSKGAKERAALIEAKPKVSVSTEVFEYASPQKSIYFEISADNFNYSNENVHKDAISISTPLVFDSKLKHKKKATLNLAHKVVVDKYHKKKPIKIGHVVEISKYNSTMPSEIIELKERAVSVYSSENGPEEEQIGTQTNKFAGVEYVIDSSVFDIKVPKKKNDVSDHKSPSSHSHHHHKNHSEKKDKDKRHHRRSESARNHKRRSSAASSNDGIKPVQKDDDDLSVFDLEMSEPLQEYPSKKFIKQEENDSEIDVNYIFGEVNNDSDAFAPAYKNNRTQAQIDQ